MSLYDVYSVVDGEVIALKVIEVRPQNIVCRGKVAKTVLCLHNETTLEEYSNYTSSFTRKQEKLLYFLLSWL